MKKYIIFSLLSLIFIFSVCAEKNNAIHPTKKIEANPINIAVMLMQENDTASMAKSCEYYGYTRQPQNNGYTVFNHLNGSSIRYKYTDSNQQFPIVEVTSKVGSKEKDKILQNLNFQKNGAALEQKSVGFITRCTFGPHGTLILRRISKKRE